MYINICLISRGNCTITSENLAKLDDGLNESPTVMVGEDNKQLGKNRGILKQSWAFVETNCVT